jgi:hypothetical protein
MKFIAYMSLIILNISPIFAAELESEPKTQLKSSLGRLPDLKWDINIHAHKYAYCTNFGELKDKVNNYINLKNSEDLTLLLKNNERNPLLEEALNSTKTGLNALQKALFANPVSVPVVALLLQYGANPNIPLRKELRFYRGRKKLIFKKRWTAAHISVVAGAPREILELFHKYNFDFFAFEFSDLCLTSLARSTTNTSAQDYLLEIYPSKK